MTLFRYDGSFDGFLTAVFEAFSNKAAAEASIRPAASGSALLFGAAIDVETDEAKAARVWSGLCRKASQSAAQRLFHCFLAEIEGSEDFMLDFLRHVFSFASGDASGDFGYPSALKVAQAARSVGREKHRMEAFVRFQKTQDGLFWAEIEPDFNVLPLIGPHFESRYADQRWLIFDRRRGDGLYYDLSAPRLVEASDEAVRAALDSSEPQFARLWQTYFKSTNIAERKNSRLHRQRVPARYWKYLTEKKPS